jgi:hypothetical protein
MDFGSSNKGGVMAKKKQPRGPGRLVRMDPSVARMGEVVARARGIALGDYLSELVRPMVSRDYVREVKRLEQEGGEA